MVRGRNVSGLPLMCRFGIDDQKGRNQERVVEREERVDTGMTIAGHLFGRA